MARELSQELTEEINAIREQRPTALAAVIPALHLVQAQSGHISEDAQLDLAELLDVPPTRIQEVVTFYTMFHNTPTGRNMVKICRNLACQVRGADRILARAEEILGIKAGETTPDGRVTLETDECLASCGTGPMLWCSCRPETPGDGEYKEQIVENLTEEKLQAFLEELK